MSDRWQNNYNDVCAYIKAHNCGISDIPYDVTTSSGITMQNWLREQYLTYCGRSGRAMSDERREILRNFGIENYRNKYDNEFYRVLIDIRRFYDENGETKIPKTDCVGETTGVVLFTWVQTQRRKYKLGQLKPLYLKWIEDAGLMWILESPFDMAYRHALEFLRVYGDLQMPTSFVCEDCFNLGKWCVAMRDRRKRGQASDEQIQMLDAIGFNWDTNNERREINDSPRVLLMSQLRIKYEDIEGVAHAEQYFGEHNDLDVPENFVFDDGFRLGRWLNVLRFRFRSNGVPTEISDKLKAMGFNWNAEKTQVLNEKDKTGLAYAENYSAYYHHLNALSEYICEGFALGEWLDSARQRYSGDRLPAELICKLQELDFIWHRSDIKWFYNFEECRKYIQEHPNTPIPQDLVSSSGTKLNSWYRNNHKLFEIGKMCPEKAELFAEIDISPEKIKKNNADMLWDEHFDDVKAYLGQHPEHSIWNFQPRVQGRHIRNLSAWLKAQIREYFSENCSLDEAQREKLCQLGIDEPPEGSKIGKQINEAWQENCMKLKAFFEAHGHTDLPEEYRELREWLLTQRGIFKRGAYSKQRMDFLRENGLIKVFRKPIRNENVKLNMTIPKAQYDALMRVVMQKGCKSIEEYLEQLGGT